MENLEHEEAIGQRLARLRKEAGLTQQELANSLGVSRSTLAEYERGTLRLHDNLLINISKILKTSADEVLGIKGVKKYKGNPSLRFLKRIKDIEKLPEQRKKEILKILDNLIFAYENK